MDDWRVTLTDGADNRKQLRRQERFWQYKLNTSRDKRNETYQWSMSRIYLLIMT